LHLDRGLHRSSPSAAGLRSASMVSSVEIASGLTGRERLVVSPPDGLAEGARVVAREAG